MFKNIIVLGALMASSITWSQDFQGDVRDASTNEPIPFASVYIINTLSGSITDTLGKFRFDKSLPEYFTVKISAQLFETKIAEAKRGETVSFLLNPSHQDLEDVIVSTPGSRLGKENAFHVDHLQLKELNAIQSTNLGEAIGNVNGVQAATTGPGISQPVIRGLGGLRVLTYVNGVRTENQQWSLHHGMAVNELGVGAVEVIKGPSSLLFGNDAFGGILFLIDELYADQNSQSISFKSLLESVSLGSTSSAAYKVSTGNFHLSAYGLYTNYADYELPNQRYLRDSRFNQLGGKINIGVSKKNWVGHFRYTYSGGRAGIPGHTHDSIPDPTSFQSELQRRDKNIPAQDISNHIFSFENRLFFKKNELSIILANTNNDLKEYEEKFSIPGIHLNLNSSVLNAKAVLELKQNWKIIPGVQAIYQFNNTDESAEEQLIPDYNQFDQGAFVMMGWSKEKWTVQYGGRVDFRSLKAPSENFLAHYVSPNFAAGFVRASKRNTVHFNLNSGSRNPHVSELLSNGVHHGALRYEIGDPNLKPERTIQVDINYEVHKEHIEVIFNPFYSYVSDFIALNKGGSLIDNLPVYNYSQIAQVNLYGIDFGFHLHPHFAHWIHLESSYNYVRAHDNPGNSISLIPQARINTFLKFNPEMKGKFMVESVVIQHQYYFEQNKVVEYESISPGYHLLNASINAKFDIRTPITISLGVKNVLNQEYINHLSQLKNINTASPGRNFYLSVQFDLVNPIKTK